MPPKREHLNFDPNFVFNLVDEWKAASEKYDQAALQHYKRIRSYLTLFQFRLTDDQKCTIREKLASCLDEISANDYVADMDSYLEGFCFQLDKSVIPTNNPPKEVKIEIAPEPRAPPSPPRPTETFTEQFTTDTLDCNDLDYYTLQFFQ